MASGNNTEGREALVHLRVPAATKARWVRDSRAAGQRLTDWIIERVERSEGQNMRVLKINDSLAGQYHGAGWALAAISGGQVVALRYVADVAGPPIEDVASGPHAAFFIRRWLDTAAAAPVVRELSALGEVSVGMCSSWEFCEQ